MWHDTFVVKIMQVPLLADEFGLLEMMILLFILLGSGLFIVILVSVQQKIALSFSIALMISLSFPLWLVLGR